jgi:hypothetical protein
MEGSTLSSGLEVVSSPDGQYSELEPASQRALYLHDGLHLWNPPAIEPQGVPERERIGGINKKTFRILVAAAVVILAAAGLGTGLGVGLSHNSNEAVTETTVISESATPSATQTPPTPAPTTLSETLVTASRGTINNETVVLYRDCPSSNNTLYSVTFDSTATYQFRKACNARVVHEAQFPNLVNQVVASLNECMNLCARYNRFNTTTSTEIRTGRNILEWLIFLAKEEK